MQHALFTAKFFPPLTRRGHVGHSRLYTLYNRPLPRLEGRSMIDRGLLVTTQAIRRQLHAMPWELYLVRLIHHATGRAFPGDRNAGYILVDLDHAEPSVLDAMRRNGHEPCVVLASSPGHRQVWIRVSAGALETAVARAIVPYLARAYAGDRASTDWRPLGRLAGFTNQKRERRQPN